MPSPALRGHGIAAAMLMSAVPVFAQTAASSSAATSDTTPAVAPGASAERTLPAMTVRGRRQLERDTTGYRAPATEVGKTLQELRDIPQSVTVVPEPLIRDRAADSLREALRNVAGLTFNAGEGGRVGDNITIRGFSVVGDLYLDGIRDAAQYNRDIFNTEQVDVLRGSASMLFGRGATGGIVNQQSKRPFVTPFRDVSITAGSYDYKRATADINQPIGQDAAVRLNLLRHDSGSSRDGVQRSTTGIAPSVSFGIGTRNEFNLSYLHLDDDRVPDLGVPYFRGRPLPVPVDRFYGFRSDYERSSANIATASWIHRFAPGAQVRTVLRRAEYARDLWGTAPRLATPNAAAFGESLVVNRQRQARGSIERATTLQSEYVGHHLWWGLRHEVLIGLEGVQEEATRWTNTGAVANPPTTAGAPDPWTALAAAYFDARTRTGYNRYEGGTVGLYAQDMVSITDTVKVMAGVRWDRFSADYARSAPAGALSRTDRVTSWRTGVIWQPTATAAYYASAGTSFNPSAELYQLDDRTANTPPERSRNVEAGAKWDLADGELSLRTAVFRTIKLDERNTDLALANVAVLSGERHTDGIELEAAGRITPQWQVFAGVALLSSNVDRASGQQAAAQDKRPINTPRYTANLWTTYQLGGGWRVAGGFDAVSERYGDAANNNEVPGYVRWDAMLAYEQRSYELRLNLLNLSDRKIYEGVYAGHVVPGQRRTALVTARLKF